MFIKEKTNWERDSMFKATSNGKVMALAITANHPLFKDLLNMINEYQREFGLQEVTEHIPSDEDIGDEE